MPNAHFDYVLGSIAWGNQLVLDASGAEIADTTHIGHLNPFRYRGYYFSTALNLYYLKSRFYDPEVGRFINADSVEYLDPSSVNGLNLYAYCGNNPVMFSDPGGHFWDVVFDIAFVAWDIYQLCVDDGYEDWENWAALGIDLLCLLLPFASGGTVAKGANKADDAIDLLKLFPEQNFVQGLGAVAIPVSAKRLGAVAVAGVGVLGATIVFSRIGKSGGYKIDHHYPNDHAPTHVHISGDDGKTKIDLNGNPLPGQRPMTPGEKKAFLKLIEEIKKTLAKWK